LSEDDTLNLLERLFCKYKSNDIISLMRNLLSIETFLPNVYADGNLKLNDLFTHLRITPKSEIYVNWYRFNDVDLFDIQDLDRCFYDIWFPFSDDIDLFDNSLDWMISIRHDGAISFVVDLNYPVVCSSE